MAREANARDWRWVLIGDYYYLRFVRVNDNMRREVGFRAWQWVLVGLRNARGTNWIDLEKEIRKQIQFWFQISAEHQHSEAIWRVTNLSRESCELITSYMFNVPETPADRLLRMTDHDDEADENFTDLEYFGVP
jgi:hypothetical protein